MNSRTILSLALLLAPALLAAQETAEAPPASSLIRAGVIGGSAVNIHRGEFATYDGILECAVFNNATTLGWNAGYLLDIPVTGSLALSTRLLYWKADGEFNSPNPYPVRVAVDDNTTLPLTTEHALETSVDYLMLEALGKWSVAGPFYIAAGPSIAVATRAAYEEEERIISPQGITFQNGESIRKIIAGNFDEQGTLPTRHQFRIGGTAAVGADIRLSDRFTLSPEVSFNYGFTNVLSSFPWKINAVRAGAGITYALGGGRVDTIAPPALMPRPVVSFDPRNQLTDGTRLGYAELVVNEERVTDVIPLLPYVFFDPKSSSIPERYRRLSASETPTFSEANLRDSVIDVYHHLLNIIGERMRVHPEATITLAGCREPLDDSGSTAALSTARATSVKEYLVSVWKIAPERIGTTAQVLPTAVSVRTVADGREENRRTEIKSSDPRILAPVTSRFTAGSVDPAVIAIVTEMQFSEAISSWNLTLTSAAGESLWETGGVGAPSAEIVWPVAQQRVKSIATVGGEAARVVAVLEATTNDGTKIRSERTIPVRTNLRSRRFNGELVNDSLVERYSLIFFDFDTPRISDFNQQVVGLIQSRVRTNSALNIIGLTDRVGDENHNLELSQARAASASDQIRSRVVPDHIRNQGAGETLIYNNDLPEGRMYNRTVIIEVATPKE